MVKIIYQQVTEDGKFVLGLEGLSSDTKPTGGVIADGSTFKETNTDAVYYLDTTWKLAKAGQLKELPTVSAGDNGKVMKVAEGAWGLGTDEAGSGSELPPYDSEDEGRVLSVDKEGDLEWVTPSGGGAEKFVVTLTADDSGAETVWTADDNVTISDIVEADEAGKIVVAKAIIDNIGIELEFVKTIIFSVEGDGTTTYVAAFSAIYCDKPDEAEFFSIVGMNRGEGDEWGLFEANNQGGLPSYSSSNNGQVLGVSSGDLAWVDVAPLIVTLTADETVTGQLNGDKTFGEVKSAMLSGKNVVVLLSVSGNDVAMTVVSVSDDGENVSVTGSMSGWESTGASADYIAFQVS